MEYLPVFQVSDFGLANHVDFKPSQSGGKFPIKWTAPEALRDNVSKVSYESFTTGRNIHVF